jgi:uncharacterized protein with PIN domain
MTLAAFRFHAELNDFLVPLHRHREFTAPCSRNATAKHMIEALGVPHTEVGLLLINDVPAGLDQLLEDGDRVTVHPVVPPETAEDDATEALRFVADAHMGGLAHLLRLCGFDTLYDNHYADAEIEVIASDENRIVLTRDRELLKRRTIARGCYVHALKPIQQIAEVSQRYQLTAQAQPFSRCLACNASLRHIDKTEVTGRVPTGVYQRQERFSTCVACQRIFWEGSHWQRMKGVLTQLGVLLPGETGENAGADRNSR